MGNTAAHCERCLRRSNPTRHFRATLTTEQAKRKSSEGVMDILSLVNIKVARAHLKIRPKSLGLSRVHSFFLFI